MSQHSSPQRTPQREERSPFGTALYTARRITTRWPADDQPAEYCQLVDAIDKLDDDSRRNLFFRLVREVLEERIPIQGLYAVAFNAKVTGPDGKTRNLVGSAHNVAALLRAIREGNLTLSDFQAAGLVELKAGEDRDGQGYTYPVYHIGHQAIEDAAKRLRISGKIAAAKVLEVHLRRDANIRTIRAETREAAVATAQEAANSAASEEKTES